VSRRFQPCSASGTGGARLSTGDSLSGSAVRDFAMQNGLVRVTYEPCVPLAELGALHLYRWDGDSYARAVSAQYGDWTFFAAPFTTACDRIDIVKADADEVIAAMVWTNHRFDVPYLGNVGVVARDHFDNQAIYDGNAALQYWTYARFTKLVKLARGREGYFVGFHSWPNLSPGRVPEWNNTNELQEREFGTGAGNAVHFSSSGFVCRHPEWGSDANWGAGQYTTRRHGWSRIDDPNYSNYADAAYITTQNAIDNSESPTYPNEQTTGPWWVADLHYENASTIPFCRYIAMAERLEVGSWQFDTSQYGSTVVHFVNEITDERGNFRDYQLFLGAFPYTSPYDLTTQAGRANEPTASLRARVADRCPLDFDASGIAQDDEPERTTTAGQVRDVMIRAVRGLTPTVAAERKFVDYRENAGPIRRYCDANPAQAPRRFSIRDIGEVQPLSASDTEVSWTETEFECVVAYPYDNGWGANAALSLDDVIESDARQIDQSIGTEGYLLLDTSNGGEACVMTLGQHREDGEACRFLVLRLSVQFWRSYS
jgi:hypothetical protein